MSVRKVAYWNGFNVEILSYDKATLMVKIKLEDGRVLDVQMQNVKVTDLAMIGLTHKEAVNLFGTWR